MSFKSDLDKFKPRKEQLDCIEFIRKTIDRNPMSKYFLLNLPTGVGKSHLAMMICDFVKKNISKTSKVDVVTNSKILQDQYSNIYSSINNLKGKSNYTCDKYNCSCEMGMELNKVNKQSCEECPYTDARDAYTYGNISLTNFHLYIINSMYNIRMQNERKSNILIVDECHELEGVLSDFISVRITERIIRRYKFSKEDEIIRQFKKINGIEDYTKFLKFYIEEIKETVDQMSKTLGTGSVISDSRNNKFSKITKQKTGDMKTLSLINDLNQMMIRFDLFLNEYKTSPDNWVMENNYNDKKEKELSLEPIWAYDYLEKYVFSRYDKVFMMSGTILDKKIFCELNGLDMDRTVYYSIQSPFPLNNRPVYYMPLGKMSYTQKEETFKNYIPYIKKILKKYKNRKGIIHTNSFELCNWIKESLGAEEPRLVFHDNTNKDEVLNEHFKTEEATVIVSPSLNVGVSFDDDRARFQVIAKIPYKSLASKKNKMRQKLNPNWYSWDTCCSLQQTYGRVCRSETDFGDTIIIDGGFSDIMAYSSEYLEKWFQDAIQIVNTKV